MELDLAAGVLLGRINHTGIERPGINVQADRSLIEFAWVVDAMHGFLRIDGAGMSGVHLHGVSGFEITRSGLELLRNHTIVFDQQPADGNGHPAILVAVVMHRASLSDLPTHGNQLVERSFVDQVAGVMLSIPG